MMNSRKFLLLGMALLVTMGAGSTGFCYTQGNLQTASDGTIETIPLEATVQESPPQISIKTYAPGTFSIYRKSPSTNDWDVPLATGITLSAEGIWTDSTVTVGTLYEYKFVNTTGTVYINNYPTGYILTGIKVDLTLPKGRMAVVVASDVPASLPAEYSQYKADLTADGWTVNEIVVPRAANYNGIGNGTLATVKVVAGGTGFVNGDNVTLFNSAGRRASAKLTVSSGAITSISVYAGGGGTEFSVGQKLTVSGGTTVGSGASLIGYSDPAQSVLTAPVIVKGGSGYINGEAVTLTGQTSGKTALCTLRVTSGAITGFTIQSSQTGFVTGEVLVMTGNSAGSGVGPLGASFVFSGSLYSVSISGFGSGYTSGDTGILTGDTSGQTAPCTITTNAAGVITSIFIGFTGVPGFVHGENLTLSGTSTGSGVGPISAVIAGPLQSVVVLAGGTNYINGTRVTIRNSSTDAYGILSVSGGAITGVTITDSGTGFTSGAALSLADVANTGTGHDLEVLTVDNTASGREVILAAGGSGYSDNARVTITGASSGATSSGSITANGGSVTGVLAVLPATFTPGESLSIVADGGGSGVTATAGVATEYHLLIRKAIQALDSAYPGELKNLAMVGKVPICRSGITDGAGADGHGNRAPYGTDAFYADLDGVVGVDWRDYKIQSSTTSTQNWPGDKVFDAQKISAVGNGRTELGFGRIDLSLGIQTETEALRTYFNKLHRYKIASADFRPGRRVCDRLLYPNEREANLQSMPGTVGMNNIEFITTSALPDVEGGQDADQLYSSQNGPYLFYFKGNGGPARGIGGKAVFWTGMQSHWGYWYEQAILSSNSNAMQERLAEDSFTLSFTWNIWGLRYIYHRMGMGFDAGDMCKQSINNQGGTFGPYTYKFNNTSNGDYHGSLYMNHMGDPALRLFMFEPPTALSVVKSGAHPALSWTASPNASVIGYHIYRAAGTSGSFVRLTANPQAGTTYTDTGASSGSHTYMVRAVRLETTGGGTFYNASLGATQFLDLDSSPTAVSIVTTSVPDFNWNTPSSTSLAAQGGVPQYTWTIASGSLPSGLSLSTEGVLSGTTGDVGIFNFTVQVADQIGQIASRALTLTVKPNSATVILPDATTYTSKQTPANTYGGEEATLVSGSSTYMYETFQRYNLSGIPLHNGFSKATLYVYVASGTAAGTYAPILANLLADSQDGWVDNGIAKPFNSYSNNGSNKVRINCPAHGFTTGTQVAIAGLTGTGAPTSGPYTLTAVNADNFDLLTVAYVSGWDYDPALAFATTASTNYNTRPTVYNTSVPTLLASGTATAGTWLQFDVTSYVAETLANDASKLMGIRLFTQTNQTVALGSQYAYGGARPYILFETSDAPAIGVNSPTVSPASVYTGSGIIFDTTVTPIPSRAGSLGLQWTKVSGPGIVAFTDPTASSTGSTFSLPGEYVVRLTAHDGVASSTRDFAVQVLNTAASGPVDSSIKLRLAFDETSGTTAGDTSGVSPPSNGTLTNGPAWTASGRVGGALSLAGAGQKVVVPDSATHLLDGVPQLSISLWFYANSLPVGTSIYSSLVTKRVAVFNKESYSVRMRGSAAGTSSPIYFAVQGATTLQGTTQIVTGNWYHVVAVFDGTKSTNNMQLYVNGFPDRMTTVTPTSVARNATSNVSIGSNDLDNFDGKMDEVRIYNRALTQAEVLELAKGVPANMGPVVQAGTPVSGNAGDLLNLSGSATDDGLPGPFILAWNVSDGPGSVSFGNPAAASTTASFAQPGEFTLRLTAYDGMIKTWAQTTASITAPAGMDTWRTTYFGTTDASGDRADSANPARDGISNLVKYALGLDPNKPYSLASAGLVLQVPAVGSGNYLSYSFTGTAADVTYIVEAVSELTGTWTTLYTHSGSAPGAVTVQDNQAVTAGSKRFMRLRVTHP